MAPGGISGLWFNLGGVPDSSIAWLLAPLALYLLLSGLDDLLVDLNRFRREQPPSSPPTLDSTASTPIAILVPMWHEARVAGPMLRHNLAALRGESVIFFVGVYPNDPGTRKAVEECQAADHRIRICPVAHDGPTSKADCLNAIWRGVLEEEAREGKRFKFTVLHDAEDLIHPGSLGIYRAHGPEWGMIQLPVLPLRTPIWEWTHGVYCDDFAESQGFDLETRVRLGAFLPGCGVGTAFRRDVMDRLAGGGDPFDESLLTEDYDTGLRLYRLGIRQRFVPLRFEGGEPVATREYFPRRLAGAIRQRGRWVAGNALQSWSRHGWGGRDPAGWRQRLAHLWFLWRDRKGLWGNPLSLICNGIFLYGLVSGAAAASLARPWPVAEALRGLPWLAPLLTANLALLLSRVAFRTHASAKVYGRWFALGVLPRMIWGNFMNAAAACRAMQLWTAHRWSGRVLSWSKTSHRYPAPAGLAGFKRPLEEVLQEAGFLTAADCQFARNARRSGEDLSAVFLRLGLLNEEQLCEATSLQHGMPLARLQPEFRPGRVARSLPIELQHRWEVVPYRADSGRIYVAALRPPTEEVEQALQKWTRMEPHFCLVPPGQFAALARRAYGHEPGPPASYNPGNEGAPTLPPAGRGTAAGAG